MQEPTPKKSPNKYQKRHETFFSENNPETSLQKFYNTVERESVAHFWHKSRNVLKEKTIVIQDKNLRC